MRQNSFRNLEAYKAGKILIKEVYRLLKKFPKEEQFAMCSQLRRASISITSNIAEGSGRVSNKEKVHFLHISYGSLMEVLSQMDIANDLEYITKEEFNKIEVLVENVGRPLSGLENYFSKQVFPTSNH